MLSPWVEKYRPTDMDDIVSHKNVVKVLNKFIEHKNFPNLLFHGLSGTGKTSIIKIISKKIYKDDTEKMVLEINASEERGIETIRCKVSQFVSIISSVQVNHHFKLVILDEIDEMTIDAQTILKKVMDKYNKNVRYCLICNFINKVLPSLQTRCCSICFSSINSSDIHLRLNQIIKKENIKITKDAINVIIEKSNGDLRKAINILQSVTIGYSNIIAKNVYDSVGCLSTKMIDDIYEIIVKEPFEKCCKLIKKITKGYSLNDLLESLYNKILKEKIDDTKKMKIIIELSNFEQTANLTLLQLIGIIGAIKKLT